MNLMCQEIPRENNLAADKVAKLVSIEDAF